MSSEKAMNRRSFIRGSAVAGGAAAAAGGLAAPAVLAQAPLVVKMQTSWPASDVWQEMAQQYATRVEEMSGGRVKVDLLPAGAVVGAFQVMDAVNDGVLDVAHSVPVYWYGKSKAASLFGTGPVWGGSATTMLSWFYQGGGAEYYRELTQDIMGLNVVGFLGFPMFAQPFGWFKQPVNTVADLQGFKYRTVGLAADLLQSMGMSVAQLPGGEIVPAMERGVIDAFEFNNPTSDRRFGAQDVTKNYMMGSYHQAMEFFEIVFNKKVYNSLPNDLKAILRYSAEAASSSNWWTAMDNYSRDLDELINKDKVNVMRTPKSIFEAQIKAWDVITKRLSDEDPFFKRVVDSQRAWAKRVARYWFFNEADYKTGYEHIFGKLGF
jgi:TRAP-type mannitol/chloroaromatic compound transport system substrate-binding protein